MAPFHLVLTIPSGKLLSQAIQCPYLMEVHKDMPDEDENKSYEEDAHIAVRTESDTELEPPPDPWEECWKLQTDSLHTKGIGCNYPEKISRLVVKWHQLRISSQVIIYLSMCQYCISHHLKHIQIEEYSSADWASYPIYLLVKELWRATEPKIT